MLHKNHKTKYPSSMDALTTHLNTDDSIQITILGDVSHGDRTFTLSPTDADHLGKTLIKLAKTKKV